MSARRLAVVVLSLAVALAAGDARAENAKAAAMQHLVRGSKLYDQGRYDEAIAELKAGYAIEARADFLYALGQAERKRGDCKAAISWYQRYVDSGPSTQRTVATLVQIDRCKQEMATMTRPPAAPPKPAPSPEPPAVATPAPPPPPPVAAPPAVVETAPPVEPPPVATATARDTMPRTTTPLYKRWWLWTIVAVVVAGGVGAGIAIALTQQRSSFDSTLPDLSWNGAALGVRF